jgi:hypothetical protein
MPVVTAGLAAMALSFDRENCWCPRWQRFLTALDR